MPRVTTQARPENAARGLSEAQSLPLLGFNVPKVESPFGRR